ncbi:MAG: hypothetical protein J6X34_05695, partial [Clostridia bacterium]|nr:hypothetical protein [Clostridia bacterium]
SCSLTQILTSYMLFLRCSFFKVPLLSEALFQGALLSDSFAIILLPSACVNNFFDFFYCQFLLFTGGKEQETADAGSISLCRSSGGGDMRKIARPTTGIVPGPLPEACRSRGQFSFSKRP